MARKKADSAEKPAKAPGRIGRPTSFTPIQAERICAKVAEGMGLEKVGDLDGFPSTKTMYRWLGSEGPEFEAFRQKYARACELRAAVRFEKLRDLGDRTALGLVDPSAARAAADIEKWCLAREAPRKYGDAMTLKGDKENPLRFVKPIDMDEQALLAIAAGEAVMDG